MIVSRQKTGRKEEETDVESPMYDIKMKLKFEHIVICPGC